MAKNASIEASCSNTIRTHFMDAVQQAQSGHPGVPVATAPVVYCLWQLFLRFDPDDPAYPNRFGVREHAMGSILNGPSRSKVRPFGSGFLISSVYSRPPIRPSAIVEIPVMDVLMPDSPGVGKDGLTDQPIEHLATLRAIAGIVALPPEEASASRERHRQRLTKVTALGGRYTNHEAPEREKRR